MRIKINHPMADRISVVHHSYSYSDKDTREIAFFRKGKWVTEPIPEFAKYHDGAIVGGDATVYGWVPTELVDKFLAEYGAE